MLSRGVEYIFLCAVLSGCWQGTGKPTFSFMKVLKNHGSVFMIPSCSEALKLSADVRLCRSGLCTPYWAAETCKNTSRYCAVLPEQISARVLVPSGRPTRASAARDKDGRAEVFQAQSCVRRGVGLSTYQCYGDRQKRITDTRTIRTIVIALDCTVSSQKGVKES